MQAYIEGMEVETAVEKIVAAQERAVEPISEEIRAIKARKRFVREMNADRPSEDAEYYLLVVRNCHPVLSRRYLHRQVKQKIQNFRAFFATA